MAEGSDALMDQLGPEQHLDGLAEGSDALTDQLGPEEHLDGLAEGDDGGGVRVLLLRLVAPRGQRLSLAQVQHQRDAHLRAGRREE